MRVLIKGIDMPQSCDECPCCSYNDIEEIYRCNYVDDIVPNAINYKLDECPLVEVPTPHGRLIDADCCIRAILNDKDIGMYNLITIGTLIEAFKLAPTIIESEDKK